MAKRITKTEIKWAARVLEEVHSYAEEIRAAEGNREAHGFLSFRDTTRRCGEAIRILRDTRTAMPAWLISNWAHYRALGWHNIPDKYI